MSPGRGIPQSLLGTFALGVVLGATGLSCVSPSKVSDGPRVLLVAIDAADWHSLNPLLEKGQLPSFQALISRGVHGRLVTVTRSPFGAAPMQWTTVATGKTWEQHGVVDYYVPKPTPGVPRVHPNQPSKHYAGPLQTGLRRAKTLWNILGGQGSKVAVVGWWATWPAEPVNGYLASSFVKYRLDHPTQETVRVTRSQLSYTGTLYANPDLRQTHPESLYGELEEMIARIERTPAASFEAQFPGIRQATHRSYHDIKWSYVANEIFTDVARHLLRTRRLDFATVMLHGIDVAYHRRTQQGVKGNLEAYYRYLDRSLGRLLAEIPLQTTVVVVSSHGHDSERNHIDVAVDGIVIMSGPATLKGRRIEGASVMDIAPTILALMDTAVPLDMPGQVLDEAFDSSIRRFDKERTLTSHEDDTPRTPLATDAGRFDAEILRRLERIGYLPLLDRPVASQP